MTKAEEIRAALIQGLWSKGGVMLATIGQLTIDHDVQEHMVTLAEGWIKLGNLLGIVTPEDQVEFNELHLEMKETNEEVRRERNGS